MLPRLSLVWYALQNSPTSGPAGVNERQKLLSIGQAAERLGVSVGTLRSWADKGLVKMIRLPSGYRRFTEDEIDRIRREMGFED